MARVVSYDAVDRLGLKDFRIGGSGEKSSRLSLVDAEAWDLMVCKNPSITQVKYEEIKTVNAGKCSKAFGLLPMGNSIGYP